MTATQALDGLVAANAEPARQGLLERLFNLIQKAGRPTIVCSRTSLGHQEVEALLSQPLVEGIVLESEDRELLAAYLALLRYMLYIFL